MNLTAASRCEHLVLYDPAAIPPDTPVDPDLEAQEPRLLPAAAMMDLASRGDALVLHVPEEDCEARFRLFVDEEPPADLRGKGSLLLAGSWLRVPSGRVRADGLEFLCPAGETRAHSQAEEAALPAGVYTLEVLNLMPWKAAHRVSEGRRGIGPMHRALNRLLVLYAILGAAMIPANLFLAPMVVAWFWKKQRWAGATRAVAVILVVDAVVLAGFWLLDASKRRYPGLFAVMDADAAFDAAHPDIVVVMWTRRQGEAPAAAAYVRAAATG
jgi:hypothetical protein